MSSRKIIQDEVELIEYINKHVDETWFNFTDWERKFVEGILERYTQYGKNMFISSKQIDVLLNISEKIV